MKCKKCGYDNERGVKSCVECGKKLNGKFKLFLIFLLIVLILVFVFVVFNILDKEAINDDVLVEETEVVKSLLEDTSWFFLDNNRIIFEKSSFEIYRSKTDLLAGHYEGSYLFYEGVEAYNYLMENLTDQFNYVELNDKLVNSIHEDIVVENLIYLEISAESYTDDMNVIYDSNEKFIYYGFIVDDGSSMDMIGVGTGVDEKFDRDYSFDKEVLMSARKIIDKNSQAVEEAMEVVSYFGFDNSKLYSGKSLFNNFSDLELLSYACHMYNDEGFVEKIYNDEFENSVNTYISLDQINEYLENNGKIDKVITTGDMDRLFNKYATDKGYINLEIGSIFKSNIFLYNSNDGNYMILKYITDYEWPLEEFLYEEVIRAEIDIDHLYLHVKVAFAKYSDFPQTGYYYYYDYYSDYDYKNRIIYHGTYEMVDPYVKDFDTYIYTFENIDGKYYLESVELASS